MTTQLYRENRENEKKKLSGKRHGIWRFCQNTGNCVCSSCKPLILKVNDMAIFATKVSNFFLKAGLSAKLVLSM